MSKEMELKKNHEKLSYHFPIILMSRKSFIKMNYAIEI